jgi:GTP-binding protein Era
VADLKQRLAERMPEGPWFYPADQTADIPARLLAAEITREKLFLRVHEELPYQAAVETTQFEERPDGSARVEQTIYVQREGHRPIILGKGGRR